MIHESPITQTKKTKQNGHCTGRKLVVAVDHDYVIDLFSCFFCASDIQQ